LADVKVYSRQYCDSCDSLNWVFWQISTNKAEKPARKQLCILLLCNTAAQKSKTPTNTLIVLPDQPFQSETMKLRWASCTRVHHLKDAYISGLLWQSK